MRKTTGLVGAVAIGSGLIATGAPAYADSTGNNGVNLLNGNDVSVSPIQVCLNGVTGILSGLIDAGSTVVSSPQTNNCTVTPVVDHPQPAPQPSQGTTGSPQPGPVIMPGTAPVSTPGAAPLPLAPQPVAVLGHSAVTG